MSAPRGVIVAGLATTIHMPGMVMSPAADAAPTPSPTAGAPKAWIVPAGYPQLIKTSRAIEAGVNGFAYGVGANEAEWMNDMARVMAGTAANRRCGRSW